MATARRLFTPRYALAHRASSKVWTVKNSRLRRFFALRGRRLQRGGLFRRYVLVATTRKWTESRRHIRPRRRRTGYGRAGGGRTTNSGRPQLRRYRDGFYRKQQLRAVHGKRRESALRTLVTRFRGSSTVASGGQSGSSSNGGSSAGSAGRALSASLEGRLDRILFRRRIRPTIYAAHQFVHHGGVAINGVAVPTPQAILRVGDTIALLPIVAGPAYKGKTATVVATSSSRLSPVAALPSSVRRERLAAWRTLVWDLFARVYYRRWGLYLLRRRLASPLRRALRTVRASITTSSRRVFLLSRYSSTFVSRGVRNVARERQRDKVSSYNFSPQSSNSFAKGWLISNSARRSQARVLGFAFSGHLARSAFRFQRKLDRRSQQSFGTTALLPLLTRAQLALRLRTTCLPRVVSAFRTQADGLHRVKPSSALLRPFRRRRRRRLLHARHRKAERRRKISRLQPVHRITPSYLQRDLRTLRATRVHAPASEEGHYAFTGSISRLAAFYRSRALL